MINLNSPHNFNRKVINLGILSGYNTKFSGLANKEIYGHLLGELAFRSWDLKG